MSEPSVIDAALSTGVSIAGGGGLVGVLVRYLMGGVTKRLDSIDSQLREHRKDANLKHEEVLERVVKAESSIKAAWKQLDALVTPPPKRKRTRRK